MSRFNAVFPSVHVYPPHPMYNTASPNPNHYSFLNMHPTHPMNHMNHMNRSRTKITQKTCVIFDWDDTLFPTTSVVCKQEKHITVGALQSLGLAVYELLGKYIDTFGANNVFIVTNGSKNWVLDSLKEMSRVYQISFEGLDDSQQERRKDYWAALYNSIHSLQLKIVSAKALYGEDHPQQPTLWKTLVFKSIVKEHFNLYSGSDNNIYCIISIGDSENEFIASHEAKQMITTMNRLNRNNNIARLHRIKLKQEPTIDEMVKQIHSLMKEVDVLLTEKGSITIQYLQETDTVDGVETDTVDTADTVDTVDTVETAETELTSSPETVDLESHGINGIHENERRCTKVAEINEINQSTGSVPPPVPSPGTSENEMGFERVAGERHNLSLSR